MKLARAENGLTRRIPFCMMPSTKESTSTDGAEAIEVPFTVKTCMNLEDAE